MLAALRARPWEYWVLGQVPAPWRAEDSVLAEYAMWWDLQANGLKREMLRQQINARLGGDTCAAGWKCALSFLYPAGTSWDAPAAEPAAGAAAQAMAAAPVPDAAALDGRRVLLVEDDPGVRLLVTEVLAELGYKTLLAANGTEAQGFLASGERIDLLVTDVGLPDVNGRVVAEIGRRTRPGLKVLFITGYAEAAAVRDDFLAPGMDLINKPFDLNTLATRLRSILDT